MKYSGRKCDFCKDDIMEGWYDNGIIHFPRPLKIKIKKREPYGKWKKLDVCTKCAEKIVEYCKKGD